MKKKKIIINLIFLKKYISEQNKIIKYKFKKLSKKKKKIINISIKRARILSLISF